VVDQKRIARNTLLLYLRMGLVMLVGLYTSRVVLDVLGEVDQGIYDAIGGVVVMFSFLSTTMSTACQRFFSFELGRDDTEGLRTVFSQSLVIFVALVLIVIVVGETAGWWFVEHKMRMAGRDDAARWVFHCSIAGFIFLLMRTPYMGMIIAREKMKVFAYISVFEALGALAVAVILQRYGADKLKLYALLTLALQTLTTAIYWLYCRLFYRECRPTLRWNGRPMTRLFRFTGWEMMGTLAGTCKTGGVSILINMFFGPLFNTPLGRAQKVYMTIAQLQTNFYMAVRPQIIKSYAVGAMAEMEKLFFQSTRLTYYLLLVIVVQATGQNRRYQQGVGATLLAILPCTYAAFKYLHLGAEWALILTITFSFIAQLVRAGCVRRQTGIDMRRFFREVVLVVLLVTLLSFALPLIVGAVLTPNLSPLTKALIHIVLSILWTSLIVYLLGITPTERKHIREVVKQKCHFING